MKKLLFFVGGVFIGWKFSQSISRFVVTNQLPIGQPIDSLAPTQMMPLRGWR